jgi:hypothetical protein
LCRVSHLTEPDTSYEPGCRAADVSGRHNLLKRHPDLAAELEKFFAEEDKLGRLAAPRRPIAKVAHIDATDTDLAAGTLHEMRVHNAVATPRSFGDYEVLDEIADGGMGVVYKARRRTGRNRKGKDWLRS